MIQLSRRHPHLAAAAAYVALAAAATWPLLARFGTEIGGDRGGPWRTLWGFWWWGESLTRGASPFFCDALRWPSGTPLWLNTSNVPAALAVLPLWHVTPGIPEVALYNLVLFASYPLAGFTAYLLCRELWGDDLAAFLAGALYMLSAFHLGQSAGQLDAASMEWSPLYFLGLVRTVRRHGVASPLMAGAALALAAMTSPYHLVFCAIGTVVLLGAWWRTDRGSLTSLAFVRRSVLLAVTFLALAGWLYAGMVRAYLAQTPRMSPGAAAASADLLSFFVPSQPSGYIGYVALALAAVAALRAKASRPWLIMGLVGFVLALGPRLHVGGVVLSWALLPFGWIERAASGLLLDAVPARFSWLMAFGVTIAAGAALALIVRTGRRGAVVATLLTALAVIEGWPGAMPTSTWPAPRFLRALARDGERWAVLDATSPARQLWNQVLHRHPQVGGDLAQQGERLDRWVADHPELSPLFVRDAPPWRRQDAIRALQELNVRFVIVDAESSAAARALRLPRAYDGDGLVVFEVPPRTG